MLGGVFGYIDLARESSEDKEVTMLLDRALSVFSRAKGLTQQLLTFSKGGVPIKKTQSLKEILENSVNFALSGSNISRDIFLDPNLWLCDIDENQIGQVIDNIVINAVQAMPMGGKIIVHSANINIIEEQNSNLPPGKYIKTSISDTGTGIQHEMLQRIFDPFFTTKQKGNGLGLATAYSIIQKHDGIIDVESTLGKGSTFHIILPASEKNYESESLKKSELHVGTGTVLLMDDEPFIREIMSELLLKMGYKVLLSKNGEEALQVIKERMNVDEKIDFAIIDLTIPGGMGGKELIHHLKRLSVDIPVFASSGYSDDPVRADPISYGFSGSIKKPFRKNDITELLNKYISKKNDTDR